MAKAEAEKLGTRRVGTTIKIANSVRAAGFGDEGGYFVGGGGGGSGYAPPAPRMAVTSPGFGSTGMSAPGGPDTPPPLPGSQPDPVKAKPAPANTPSPEEIAQITASAVQRSGAVKAAN